MIASSDRLERALCPAGTSPMPPGPVLISGISSPCCSARSESDARSASAGEAGIGDADAGHVWT